eukprot:scaffold4051_cov52-Attheya_sp.AAC.3
MPHLYGRLPVGSRLEQPVLVQPVPSKVQMVKQVQAWFRVEWSVDMFVDDSSLTVNSMDPMLPTETIMEQTQNNASSWSKFLWISGGLFELTKTKYYMLIWQFSNLRTPYLCPEEEQPSNTQ